MSDPLEAIEAMQHQILKEVRDTNGMVKRHDEEIFGNPEHETVGMKSDLRAVKIFIIQAKTVAKIAIAVIAFFGVTNILILIRAGT